MEFRFAYGGPGHARYLELPEPGVFADQGDVNFEVVFVEFCGFGRAPEQGDEFDHGRLSRTVDGEPRWFRENIATA